MCMIWPYNNLAPIIAIFILVASVTKYFYTKTSERKMTTKNLHIELKDALNDHTYKNAAHALVIKNKYGKK